MTDPEYIAEIVAAMDGLIERLAVIVASHLPSTEQGISAVMSEWNQIKHDIKTEYDDD